MKIDLERLKQAAQETVITAAVAFALPFFAYLMGLVALPELDALQAVLRAGTLAALVAVGKGGFWYFTGTKIVPEDGDVLETGKAARRVGKRYG